MSMISAVTTHPKRRGPTMNGRRATLGQRQYALARVQGKSQRDASNAAGYVYNRGTIRRLEQISADILVREAEAQGITPELIARTLREGLDSMVVKSFKTRDDTIVERSFPDHRTRLRYVDFICRLMDWYPDRHSARNGASVAAAPGASDDMSRFAQEYGHLSNEEITEKMQEMRAKVAGNL